VQSICDREAKLQRGAGRAELCGQVAVDVALWAESIGVAPHRDFLAVDLLFAMLASMIAMLRSNSTGRRNLPSGGIAETALRG
jgi:hypothetical protein